MYRFFFWLVVFHTLFALGITVGYHRLLTHRSFRCPRWLEYLLATVGWAALMGPPVSWVAVHRLHHAYPDEALDPHSPVQRGWWWSQVGWIGDRKRQRRLWQQGRLPDGGTEWANTFSDDTQFLRKYAKDLYQNAYYRKLSLPLSLVLLAATAVVCLVAGGWPMAMGRLVAALTVPWCTWYVNSYGHSEKYGYRNFEGEDSSRNVWWVALLTQGEGWHNNHHYRPLSARHGMRWWEFDLSWVVISLLARLHLAWDVHACTYEEAQARARRKTAA
ncbi:MAG TPA: fatty acid desaturase [Candidatus Xenobia bacterium]